LRLSIPDGIDRGGYTAKHGGRGGVKKKTDKEAQESTGHIRRSKIDIEHTQEGIGHGHQPGGQVEGEQRERKRGKDEKA
jgi:hypothetical protein